MQHNKVDILGAGLVGSLLSLLLAKKGGNVNVFEKRGDPRTGIFSGGRSINLALSHRGIRALQVAGAYESIREQLIPMKGRMMHDLHGNLTLQPYGTEDQFINSVSRAGLNQLLITQAEAEGAVFHFSHTCKLVDLEKTSATFQTENGRLTRTPDVIIGADGAYSVLRKSMQKTDRFNFQQHYIEHGYKELSIEPKNGDFALEPNYLHIWPRGNFMLIALPNPDRSFTCTLFFPFEGELSFAALQQKEQIATFFGKWFPDVIPLMPDYLRQFQANREASLVTIKAGPWVRNQSMLIGDASHAIVPFYGQGMNAGFEDCRLFMEWGERLNFDWSKLLPYFYQHRKADADAIADLAMRNFVEMRDKVADDRFLAIKRLEARLQEVYKEWVPLYTMVTFTDIPYRDALSIGLIQEKILRELPADFDPETIDLKGLMETFSTARQAFQ